MRIIHNLEVTMKFLKSLLPLLVTWAIIIGGGVSYATVYKWSQTAATNATADPSINWAEGMAPSAVNDSARAMMAATAKWRDDLSGKLVTGGSSTAYTLTSNQVFSSLANMDGAEMCFRMNVTSGAAPTLNVDALGAKALNQVSGTAVATGALISGGVYCAVYVNASNEWIVKGIAGQIASGTKILVTSSACPTGYTIDASSNDKALIISSTTGGSTAGTNAFTTMFSGSFASGATTLTTAQIPAHTHNFSGTTSGQSADHSHTYGFRATTAFMGSTSSGPQGWTGDTSPATSGASNDHTHNYSGTTDGGAVSGGSHTHTIPSVQYVTAIACTKN